MKANVLVVGDGERVCLCLKHFGDEIPGLLRTALYLGRDNWDYAEGLKDIIFRYMLFDYIGGIAGYEIPQEVIDGTEPVITVDVDTQSISVGGRNITFSDYVNYNH